MTALWSGTNTVGQAIPAGDFVLPILTVPPGSVAVGVGIFTATVCAFFQQPTGVHIGNATGVNTGNVNLRVYDGSGNLTWNHTITPFINGSFPIWPVPAPAIGWSGAVVQLEGWVSGTVGAFAAVAAVVLSEEFTVGATSDNISFGISQLPIIAAGTEAADLVDGFDLQEVLIQLHTVSAPGSSTFGRALDFTNGGLQTNWENTAIVTRPADAGNLQSITAIANGTVDIWPIGSLPANAFAVAVQLFTEVSGICSVLPAMSGRIYGVDASGVDVATFASTSLPLNTGGVVGASSPAGPINASIAGFRMDTSISGASGCIQLQTLNIGQVFIWTVDQTADTCSAGIGRLIVPPPLIDLSGPPNVAPYVLRYPSASTLTNKGGLRQFTGFFGYTQVPLLTGHSFAQIIGF